MTHLLESYRRDDSNESGYNRWIVCVFNQNSPKLVQSNASKLELKYRCRHDGVLVPTRFFHCVSSFLLNITRETYVRGIDRIVRGKIPIFSETRHLLTISEALTRLAWFIPDLVIFFPSLVT